MDAKRLSIGRRVVIHDTLGMELGLGYVKGIDTDTDSELGEVTTVRVRVEHGLAAVCRAFGIRPLGGKWSDGSDVVRVNPGELRESHSYVAAPSEIYG